jgi:hypothetical protein
MAPEDLRDTLTSQVEALEAALARVTAERDWLGRQVKALAAERERLAAACEGVLVYLEHGEGSAPNGWRLITAMGAIRTALNPLKSGAT